MGVAEDAGFFSTSLPRKTCAGRIAAFCSQASENRNGPNGFDSRMTTVSGSGVSISLMALPGATNFEPNLELTSSSVNFTSSDVTGLPSLQVAVDEVEGVGQAVGRDLPRLRQRRHDVEAFGEAHEPVVEHAAGQHVGRADGHVRD